jgi:two-component system chemotaxis response regulator CheY
MANIMTIDDSVTMRQMLAQTLSSAGYQVVEAKDGPEALLLARGSVIHLFISDLNMPGMDGIALIKELRALEAYRHTPILVLTTEMDQQVKDSARSAGATGWIGKPFDPERLLEVIRTVCG